MREAPKGRHTSRILETRERDTRLSEIRGLLHYITRIFSIHEFPLPTFFQVGSFYMTLSLTGRLYVNFSSCGTFLCQLLSTQEPCYQRFSTKHLSMSNFIMQKRYVLTLFHAAPFCVNSHYAGPFRVFYLIHIRCIKLYSSLYRHIFCSLLSPKNLCRPKQVNLYDMQQGGRTVSHEDFDLTFTNTHRAFPAKSA